MATNTNTLVTWLLLCCQVLRAQLKAVAAAAAAPSSQLHWVGYLSSTGEQRLD
jgi:hypothetical protein